LLFGAADLHRFPCNRLLLPTWCSNPDLHGRRTPGYSVGYGWRRGGLYVVIVCKATCTPSMHIGDAHGSVLA
jgi:hypothetical protein